MKTCQLLHHIAHDKSAHSAGVVTTPVLFCCLGNVLHVCISSLPSVQLLLGILQSKLLPSPPQVPHTPCS